LWSHSKSRGQDKALEDSRQCHGKNAMEKMPWKKCHGKNAMEKITA